MGAPCLPFQGHRAQHGTPPGKGIPSTQKDGQGRSLIARPVGDITCCIVGKQQASQSTEMS